MTHTEARISNERLEEGLVRRLQNRANLASGRYDERDLVPLLREAASEIEALEVQRKTMAADWSEFCEAVGVDVDTHETVAAELQALRAPAEAKPISWLSFNDNSEPYLTGNQAEMIKLEAAGPGPHALYARPRPSPSDGEVSDRVLELARDAYEDFAGEITSKQALRLAINCALQSSKGGQP